MLLLKAVATALVLIAGAAVVLWYANTLNSWVLGGLIGGLAALLLSIPISLTLFSYLSHRHDGHARLEEEKYQESVSLSYDYDEEGSERALRKISIEAENEYLSYHRGVWGEEYEEDDQHYLPDASRRQLPAPRVPTAHPQPVHRPSSNQYGTRETRQLPARDIEMGSQHTTSRRPNNVDFPGYQPEMTRSQFQSQALRIAREEAYRRSEKEEIDNFLPRHVRRPSSPLRTRKLDTSWKEKPITQYSYRQDSEDLLDEQDVYPLVQPRYLRRGRRIVDASLSPNSPYRQSPDSTEEQAHQIDRSSDSEAEDFDQTYITGNLKKPLVRRAPYMYDNDALKSELSQQVDPPITRRSSRNLFVSDDDE
jgi:hypothetical protein